MENDADSFCGPKQHCTHPSALRLTHIHQRIKRKKMRKYLVVTFFILLMQNSCVFLMQDNFLHFYSVLFIRIDFTIWAAPTYEFFHFIRCAHIYIFFLSSLLHAFLFFFLVDYYIQEFYILYFWDCLLEQCETYQNKIKNAMVYEIGPMCTVCYHSE